MAESGVAFAYLDRRLSQCSLPPACSCPPQGCRNVLRSWHKPKRREGRTSKDAGRGSIFSRINRKCKHLTSANYFRYSILLLFKRWAFLRPRPQPRTLLEFQLFFCPWGSGLAGVSEEANEALLTPKDLWNKQSALNFSLLNQTQTLHICMYL